MLNDDSISFISDVINRIMRGFPKTHLGKIPVLTGEKRGSAGVSNQMSSSKIPGQCPECGSVYVSVVRIAPSDHDRGDGWATRAECDECPDYVEWID